MVNTITMYSTFKPTIEIVTHIFEHNPPLNTKYIHFFQYMIVDHKFIRKNEKKSNINKTQTIVTTTVTTNSPVDQKWQQKQKNNGSTALATNTL